MASWCGGEGERLSNGSEGTKQLEDGRCHVRELTDKIPKMVLSSSYWSILDVDTIGTLSP